MAVRAGDAAPTVGMVPTGTVGLGDAAPTRTGRLVARRSRFLLGLVVAAFVLRAVAAVVLHEVSLARGGDGFFFVDDRGYDEGAWQQALAWRGDGPGVPPAYRYLLSAYIHSGAALYYVLGHQPLAFKLLNCLLGALTAGLVYLLARRLFGPRAAAWAGAAAALFPSTFLWSLTTLRDTMFLFAAALLLWLLTELLTSGRWHLILPMLAAFALVGNLRIYVQPLFAGLMLGAVLLQRPARLPRKWPLAAVLSVGCLAVFSIGAGPRLLGAITTLERINQQRSFAAAGSASAFAPESRPVAGASVRELIEWLPTGAAYTVAAPFPWAMDRAVELATLPEVLAWYAAAALALLGAFRHRRAWREWIHLAGFVGGILLLLALTSGNLGTLVRHRGMAIPFVLVFGGAGAAWLWSGWRARRPAAGSARIDAVAPRPAVRGWVGRAGGRGAGGR